jgi:DNA replication protein DnaC
MTTTTPTPDQLLVEKIMAGRTFQPTADPELYPDDDPSLFVRLNAETAARLHLAHMPPRFRGALLEQLKPEQHPESLTAWLDRHDAQTLILVGDFGAGKSYAAAAVANEAAVRAFRRSSRNQDVRWWNIATLLDDLRPSAPDAEGTWERAKTVPLLVLDDWGHVRVTDWATEQMWKLINARVEAGLRQIVTTTAVWGDLVQVWGQATMDRVREASVTVRVDGKSRRRPLPLGDAS